MDKKNTVLTIITIVLLITVVGCQRQKNSILDYLEKAEIQYENDIQKANIRIALNDIITLPEEKLKVKRYKDYTGKEGQWDLPTLILRHFVPDKKGKSLGNNFYSDVKSDEVQKKIKAILETLK